MSPSRWNPPPLPAVGGLLVLGLAALILQLVPRLDTLFQGQSRESLPKRGQCVYQVFADRIALGVAFLDRPSSLGAILTNLGDETAQGWRRDSGVIRCGSTIRLNRETTEYTVEPLPGRVLLLVGKRIDINQASVEDLAAIPGVGLSLARRIVRVRDTGGPFSRIGDLSRVPGVGPEKLRRIKEHVTVEVSDGINELEDVHAAGGLLDPTRRVHR